MPTAIRLGDTTFTMPSETEVVVTRVLGARRTAVFDAWTDPANVRQWMTGGDDWTMPVCAIDLREGGEWHFVWRRFDGTELEMRGVYREIVRPDRLVNTESWGGDWPETLTTLTLAEEDGGTRITLTTQYPSREARDAALATGTNESASRSLDRLAEHLRTSP